MFEQAATRIALLSQTSPHALPLLNVSGEVFLEASRIRDLARDLHQVLGF